eukprot:CAMPEP_0172540534 /NCGR_PEP_ID=MMETSP1067-20121228/11526_1 /TAXON_ID=265564 ORGANISM="Thalassiosira punctigera, Strain Tpunct2005C2" /NCGR_SAMPLE_ID=MMETSP1067 /ASSEMBLY_ACC=CAM_ASM_000444 /LENGTH=115 /DNA_ID=CAMNT_0013326413 /DNA_START=417 /DNA_END=764 /DNA_ORIENTATION=-
MIPSSIVAASGRAASGAVPIVTGSAAACVTACPALNVTSAARLRSKLGRRADQYRLRRIVRRGIRRSMHYAYRYTRGSATSWTAPTRSNQAQGRERCCRVRRQAKRHRQADRKHF